MEPLSMILIGKVVLGVMAVVVRLVAEPLVPGLRADLGLLGRVPPGTAGRQWRQRGVLALEALRERSAECREREEDQELEAAHELQGVWRRSGTGDFRIIVTLPTVERTPGGDALLDEVNASHELGGEVPSGREVRGRCARRDGEPSKVSIDHVGEVRLGPSAAPPGVGPVVARRAREGARRAAEHPA